MTLRLHGENSRCSKLVEKVEMRAKERNEGRGERREVLSSSPPLPPFVVVVVVVVFAKILQAFTRSETFVTQAYVQKEFNYTTGLVWDSCIASVSLFWDINMVDVMSCEK